MSQRDKAQALIKKAKDLESSKDPVQYVNILENARETDPYLSETFLLLGLHFYQTEKWLEAVENLSRYCQMDYTLINDEKKAQNIYLGLAKSCQKLEKKAESLKYIKSFIGLFPSSQLAMSLVDQVYRKLPEKVEWISVYQKGFKALKEGKYQEALESFGKSLNYNPSFSWTHYHMGLAFVDLHHESEAIESLKKAREDDNEYVFLYLLGKAYRMLGKPREAEAFLKEALDENHYFVPAHMEIGELYMEQSKIDKARGYITKAIELDPEGSIVAKARELLKSIEGEKGTTDTLSTGLRDAETQARRIIQKAEEEAQSIVEKARDEELNIILNAQEQAWNTLENAREEAEKEKEKLYAEFNAVEQQKEAGIIVEKAREEAGNIIGAAKREESELQKNALNQSSAILKEANEKAREIVEKAEREMVRIVEEAKRSETGIIQKARNEEKEILDKARQEAAAIIDEARAIEASARRKIEAVPDIAHPQGAAASGMPGAQPITASTETKPPEVLPGVITSILPDAGTPILPVEEPSLFPLGKEEAQVSWDLGALNGAATIGGEKCEDMIIPTDSQVTVDSASKAETSHAAVNDELLLDEDFNAVEIDNAGVAKGVLPEMSMLDDELGLSIDDILAELDDEESSIKMVDKKTDVVDAAVSSRDAEDKARQDAEDKARQDAEDKARQDAEDKARAEVEERDKKIAEEKLKRESEEKARKEAEDKARKIADEKTKLVEAEERARKEALEKTKQETAERIRREEEEQARLEAEEPQVDISTLNDKDIVEKGDFETFVQLIGFDLKKEVKKKTQKLSKETSDLIKKAEEHYDLNEWDKAMELYLQLKEKDPENEMSYVRLSEIYAIRGLFSDVITQNCELVRILFENGEVDRALEMAEKTVGLDAMGFKPRMCLIIVNRKKGDFERFVNESLELARLYSEEGMGERSMKLISKLQKLAPDNLEVAVKLADSFMVEGRMDRAEAQYRMLADKFREAGRKDKAADALRKVKVLITPDSSLLMALGNLYMELQNYDAAEAEFRGALKLNINDINALKALGTVCLAKGAFRDSILAFNKVSALDSQDLYAREQIGNIHRLTGNKDLAIRSLSEVAGLYEKARNIAKALEVWQMVLEIDPDHTQAMDEIDRLKKLLPGSK
ncbi:MAG: tetratricopeptide repeat protein [Candidatus Xenobiia bacterium LiM19]